MVAADRREQASLGAKEQVGLIIDSMVDEVLSRVSGILRTPSVNPNYPGVDYKDHIGGEAAANRLLEPLYAEADAQIQRIEISPDRPNLVGTIVGSGARGGRSLILNGHVDTVPPGRTEEWRWGDPYSGRVEDGRVWGRGASDQKAALVAGGMAGLALRRAGIRLAGDLILQSVVGEEVGEHDIGVQAVIEAGIRADGAIVTEPTAPVAPNPMDPPTCLLVAPVTAGLLWLTIEVIGKRAHNNLRPEFIRAGGVGEAAGVNAIEKGVYVLTALQHLEQQWGQDYVHPLFKPGHFTLHPGVISGGPHGALVPFFASEFCRIDYSILYPPDVPSNEIERVIENYVARACSLDPWLEKHPPAFTWHLDWPPSVLEVEHPLTQAVVEGRRLALGEPRHEGPDPNPRIRGFDAVDDATFLNAAGIPTLSCGPGSIQFAHAIDENVAISDIIAAIKTYTYTAIDWCGIG
jgi:acetylornithine deacetylase/succinyl-diaminopimelate desuccinylase-like protein